MEPFIPKSLPPAVNQTAPASWYSYDMEPEAPGVPLSHYLWILKRHGWKILGFVGFCIAATVIVSARLTPIYEATATVDIDRQEPTSVVGQDAMRAPSNDADQFIATQVRLVQSDSVLRPVAQQYHLLDIEKGSEPLTYAEEDAPVLLKKLKVTRPPSTFLLLISYRDKNPQLASIVANAVARSYVEHTYAIRFRASAALGSFMEKQLEELKAKMERSSAALAQFERELNVINPEEKTSILSARLLQLNTEYTNAQTDRVRKESAWKSVRDGSLESAQVSSQGENLKILSGKLDEARQKFADVQTHYGPNHPEYRKAAVQVQEIERQLQQSTQNTEKRVEVEYNEALGREAMLAKALAQTKNEFDRLNARSFEYQALKRDAAADKTIYEELVRKIKEAGINAGFQNSAIRLADAARPPLKPVFPKMGSNILLAFFFSSLLGIGAAILSDVLDSSIRDPQQISSLFKTDVIGSLPLVRPWRGRLVTAGASGDRSVALARRNSRSGETVTGFEEAIRTLRNSVLLGMVDRNLKSIMFTSAAPAEGKTTIAVHFAIAHAEQNHKTLLIDCDLRRPSVHRKLGISPGDGLAAALQNGMLWREKLVKTDELPSLDILPSGQVNRQAPDLIGVNLGRILEEASKDYELVVVDAPPILGFSEPLQLSAVVDGVVVVAVAGQTNRKAVGAVLNTLQRVRANVVGLVLNEVTKDLSDSYHYYGYYGKYYSEYYKQTKA